MILRAVQMEITPGKPWENAQKIVDMVGKAKREGIEILVFPELAVPGYLLGDLWESYDYLNDCEAADRWICENSQNMTLIWGSVGVDFYHKGEDGHVRRMNCFKVAKNGEFLVHPKLNLPYFPKTLSPNYRLFDENRYFYDLRKWADDLQCSVEDLICPIQIDDHILAISLCEDGWDDDYNVKPMDTLQKAKPRLHINLSCSPFSIGKAEKRYRVFQQRAYDWETPILYLNAVSAQNTGKTIYGFDGRSSLYTAKGKRREWGALYGENFIDFNLAQPLDTNNAPEYTEMDLVFATLKHQVLSYLKESGLKRVVIGASGGVDSAVSAAFFAEVIGPENLLLVNMPSRFNSDTTKSLAKELAENLGCWYTVVDIEKSVAVTREQMGELPIELREERRLLKLTPFHFENVQARDRSARVLSALACSFGGVFTCNANKAEMTVGYSTLYGDLGGFLAPLGDLWKGQVYEFGKYLNAKAGRELIPEGIFTVVPSAELSDEQDVDAGKGDPMTYWYHDALFKSWVEDWVKKTPADLLQWYCDEELNEKLGLSQDVYDLFPNSQSFIADLERWWKLFRGLGVVKRVQAPPVCAVSRRPFGFDFREAIMNPPLSRKFLDLRQKLLSNEE